MVIRGKCDEARLKDDGTHKQSQDQENLPPSIILLAGDVASLELPAARSWEENEANSRAEHCSKGEEHREECEEVLLGVRQVLQEERTVRWHRATKFSSVLL